MGCGEHRLLLRRLGRLRSGGQNVAEGADDEQMVPVAELKRLIARTARDRRAEWGPATSPLDRSQP